MLLRLTLAVIVSIAAAIPARAQALSAEQAKRDAAILVATMSALHPALDKYRSPADVAAAFERFRKRAEDARTVSAMYLAATELAAAVRCGHTWTNVLNQQGAARVQLLEPRDKLPLNLSLVDGRWLVLRSAVAGIAAGDELLTIDGHSATQVVGLMLPYLRADGASDGKRLRQLGHDRDDYSMMDIVWPLLSPPTDGMYRLTARRGDSAPRSFVASALTLAERTAILRPARRDDAWSLRIEGGRAVMTLPTFSVYRAKFDWQGFFTDSFVELERRKVGQLVIDIRRNEGGDGAIGLELLSWLVNVPQTHVSDQSVTSYERVPYKYARYLDTWNFDFFDRTGMVDKIVDGPQAGRLRFLPNASKLHTIVPRPGRFAGKVWLLTGAENSSATFMLARLAQASGAATLVGQASGGNLRGLNGGQLAWVTLPASGVAVDIPLLATSYSASTPDASITPNVLVTPNFELRAAGRDQELEAVSRLIDNR